MSRSSIKGPYIDPKLLKKIMRMIDNNDKKVIKTWRRGCDIPPEFVGFTFAVHNGKQHIPVFITENMVGHKLGEFSPTRKFKGHGGRLARETGTLKPAEGAAPAAGAAAPAKPTAK